MKTLISSTDTSATYEFAHDSSSRTVTYERAEGATENPDFEAMAETEHALWLVWLGVNN